MRVCLFFLLSYLCSLLHPERRHAPTNGRAGLRNLSPSRSCTGRGRIRFLGSVRATAQVRLHPLRSASSTSSTYRTMLPRRQLVLLLLPPPARRSSSCVTVGHTIDQLVRVLFPTFVSFDDYYICSLCRCARLSLACLLHV